MTAQSLEPMTVATESPRCTGIVEWPPFVPKQQCRNQAAVRVIGGCRHEHVKEKDLCPVCYVALSAGLSTCNDCDEIDGHDCPVGFQVQMRYGAES